MSNKNLKVALVQDWLTGMRGGEKILETLCELYPTADLFTMLHNPGSVSALIEDRKITTSFIDRLPLKKSRYRTYLPLFPTAVELLDLKAYDLILSTSHCVAKGVIPNPNALHISYVHSPMRYVWDMYHEYFNKTETGFLMRRLIPFFANYLRQWDVNSSNRVDHFIANSAHVSARIRKYYRRESTIIYPPVNTEQYKASDICGDYYLIVSALVPYKRVDLAIAAFNQLRLPLHIVGIGPQSKMLRRQANSNIQFFDWLSADELSKEMAECRGLVFPGEEDFGIVPLEAQACGKPVIAYEKGGALETVIGPDSTNNHFTGVFFKEQSVDSLMEAIQFCENQEWDVNFIHNHAKEFGPERFRAELSEFIGKKVEAHFA